LKTTTEDYLSSKNDTGVKSRVAKYGGLRNRPEKTLKIGKRSDPVKVSTADNNGTTISEANGTTVSEETLAYEESNGPCKKPANNSYGNSSGANGLSLKQKNGHVQNGTDPKLAEEACDVDMDAFDALW